MKHPLKTWLVWESTCGAFCSKKWRLRLRKQKRTFVLFIKINILLFFIVLKYCCKKSGRTPGSWGWRRKRHLHWREICKIGDLKSHWLQRDRMNYYRKDFHSREKFLKTFFALFKNQEIIEFRSFAGEKINKQHCYS